MKRNNFEKAIVTLEFDKIRQMLCDVAPTAGAKSMALSLMPSASAAEVRTLLAETDAAKAMQALKGMPPFYGIADVTDSLERADKGAVLSTRELLDIGSVLRAARGLREYANLSHSEENALTEYFSRLVPNKYLEEKISVCIQSEDMISDAASEKLADIRRHIRIENSRVREILQKYITSPEYSKHLQEQIVTMRDGRYVIPVRAESKNEIRGLVHDTSASGATLFIEPLSVVEANNNLRVLETKERDEIERILAELSADASAAAGGIIANYENITLLAFAFAKSQLSLKMEASAPIISDKCELEIFEGRHPLLRTEKVVPINVSLGKNFDTLVITGPNTGGKTVALKTIGLFSLMAGSGLHIPAASGSTMCVFSDVLADIGDEQSIEQSLSTFSAHMVNIVDILSKVSPKTLVLLDELGAGTDPVEGAALAVSILEAVRESGALCAATTHYAELKSFAIETDGVCNASCEFDVKTLRPTYRLIIGTPGRSNAFAISERLGISKKIIDRAQRYVSGEDKRFENVIEQLEKTRTEAEKAKSEAEKLLAEAKKERLETAGQTDALRRQAEKELEKARATAVRTVESAKASSAFIFEQMDKVAKAKEKPNLREEMDRARAEIRKNLRENEDTLNPVVERTAEGYVLPRTPVAGDKVIIVSVGQHGEVVSEPDAAGNIAVRVGSAIMKTKLKNLMFDERADKKQKGGAKAAVGTSATFSPEIDLRGMYGDDAELALDKYVDDAKRAGVHEIRIIHGKGTGALRKAVQAFLRSDKRIANFRIGNWGEGDTGVTIAELK